jgi:Protein of unknown function (DUF2924)
MDAALAEKIENLPSLTKPRLLEVWAENFKSSPPPNLRKDLMVPILAYRMQEREYGGLSHRARTRLREIAASLRAEKAPGRDSDSGPGKGTKLIRTWQGEVHEVLATASGYEYRGKTYSSLSRIAREITGTRWSGPLFFGVKK